VTRHDDMLYVALMRDEIRGVMEAIQDRSREAFMTDELRIGAAALHFVRLAERPLKTSAAFRAAHPEIPWDALAAIRDRVEPEQFREDPAVIWEIATRELPEIADALESLLPPDQLWRYRADDRDVEHQTDWPGPEPESPLRVTIPGDALDEICRRYDVTRIRVFGSVLRDDFRPDSDIDMMVDFGPDAPGGWDRFHLDVELEELLGHKVDVIDGEPIRYIREQVLAEARTIYAPGMSARPGQWDIVRARCDCREGMQP